MANWVNYEVVTSTGAVRMPLSGPASNKTRPWAFMEIYSRSTGPDLYVRADGSTAAAAGNADENATLAAGKSMLVDYLPAGPSVKAASGSIKVEVRGLRRAH